MAARVPDVELTARAYAQELRIVRTGAPWRISRSGEQPRRDVRRKNLPRQARPGETYTDVQIDILHAVTEERDEQGDGLLRVEGDYPRTVTSRRFG